MVNPYVFRVILKMESGVNPATTGSRIANETVKVGIYQFDSMHFKPLARNNIALHHCSNPASVPMWRHGIWLRSSATRQHLVCLWPRLCENPATS